MQFDKTIFGDFLVVYKNLLDIYFLYFSDLYSVCQVRSVDPNGRPHQVAGRPSGSTDVHGYVHAGCLLGRPTARVDRV